jgi:hypothetical protein
VNVPTGTFLRYQSVYGKVWKLKFGIKSTGKISQQDVNFGTKHHIIKIHYDYCLTSEWGLPFCFPHNHIQNLLISKSALSLRIPWFLIDCGVVCPFWHLNWNLISCVLVRFSITGTYYLIEQLKRRKNLFWIMASEVLHWSPWLHSFWDHSETEHHCNRGMWNQRLFTTCQIGNRKRQEGKVD